MAWDSPRRGADPLARTWGRQFIGVDELDFCKSVPLVNTHDDDDSAKMGKLLSPIDEEGYGVSYDAPLAVHLTVRFNDPPIKSVHSHSYYSSRSFRPTDRTCRGLVRRIDHCSEELITRKDSDALNNIQCLRKGPKLWRFEMTFKIAVKGHSGPWAERIFISYQKQALNSTSAKEVLNSAHSIVGLFLQRHDKGFHWREGPSEGYFSDSPETFRPDPHGAPNLGCIPRSPFVASAHNWDFVPGYTLKLVLRSNNSARAQSSITRAVRIDSAQTSPLNLGLGEDLLWQAYKCVQNVLDATKDRFDTLHANCDDYSGHCQHHEKDALSLELKVANNLGPVYDHLQRSIQSKLCLFGHPEGHDCDDFADTVRQQFRTLRTQTDQKIEKLPDLDFRIAELIGEGWQQHNCAHFLVRNNHTLTRRNIEALLDRIRTSVCDVLKGHDVAIRMVAYKRGHLVLDKALVARDRHLGSSEVPSTVIDQLKERIQKDIDMICKDTYSLDDIPEVAPLFMPIRPQMVSSRPFTPRPANSYRTPPGSPASFRTRPPTPPGVPPRLSSSRIFPLVPTKYKDTPDAASVGSRSPISVKMPPIIREDSQENQNFSGLKPPAEVFANTRIMDFDAESNSTHSSMPTLAESDTPSPDQSMLITPSFVRSSSPPGFHRISSLSAEGTSASSRTSYSEVHEWAESKEEKIQSRTAPSTRPWIDATDSVPVNTPKNFNRVQMLPPQHAFEGISGADLGSGTNTIACPDIVITPKAEDSANSGSEIESSEQETNRLSTEGWLLHASESDDANSETPNECLSPNDLDTATPEIDPTGLQPPPKIEETLIGEASANATQTKILKHDSTVVDDALSDSGPAETSESVEWSASDTNNGRDLNTNEASSHSKLEEEVVNSETIETAVLSVPPDSEPCPVGVSEMSEIGSHVTLTLGSDPEMNDCSEALPASGPELVKIQEHVANNMDESPKDGLEEASTSDPSSAREAASDSSIVTEDAVSAILEGPETEQDNVDSQSLVSPVLTRVPTLVLETATESESTKSAPTHEEQPSSERHLLPEPNPQDRHSWSSSSEWEDWISEARQSSDSVDTIKASVHSSIAEDTDVANHPPDSPKRLRTPTAGLLGLSESRWADFGIRSALTGTHAFDTCRPSTAPMQNEEFVLRAENARPATPVKTGTNHHGVRHKKSVSSILFMGGGKSTKLNKKQSRDLKKLKAKIDSKKSVAPVDVTATQEGVEDAGRFPRAMMLVAGLAFASSVVSRNST